MSEVAELDPVESGISEGPSELEQIASDWAAIQAKNAPAERDEAGKFATKDATPEPDPLSSPPLEGTEAPSVAPVEKPEIVAKPSPLSWKKEIADKHWNTVPDELKDEILRREDAVAKGFESHKLDAQIGQAFTEVIKPFMPTLQSIGVEPQVAIKELLSADANLRHGTAVQKAQMAAKILNDYGVSLDELNKVLQAAPAQPDPQYSQLNQRLAAMESQQTRQVQEREQAETARIASEIAAFKQGKPHFDAVEAHMASLIAGKVAKTLDEAYDMAVYANPVTRALEQAQRDAEAKAEATKKAEAARKAAAANIKARGTLPATNPALPEKQFILEKARELGLAH